MDRELVARLQTWTAEHDGVITTAEVRSLGGTKQTARSMVGACRWRRVGRGIFVSTAAPLDPRMTHRVALAAAGVSAVLSHRSAAWVLDLIDRPPRRPAVTVAHGVSARLPTEVGVAVHRSRSATPAIRERGFPVTTAARTLVDLAALAPPAKLDPLLDRALAGRLVSPEVLGRELAGSSGRRWVRAFGEHLAVRGTLDLPGQSVLEAATNRLVVDLTRRWGLPAPEREHRVHELGYRLDYSWPEVGLAVEVDGYRWHGKERMAHDYERRADLVAQRWTVLPFTWDQVLYQPEVVALRIAETHRWLAEQRRPA